MTHKTVIGQHLDTNSQSFSGPIDLDRVTEERYSAIVRHKTAFYSFYLPCALGMTLGGIKDSDLFTKCEKVSMVLGEYFQTQDDYLDCFGDVSVIGKIGTDIEERKCSWLLCQTLKLCNGEERAWLQGQYGLVESVAAVKDLYRKYDMPGLYAKYEDEAKKQADVLIEDIGHKGLEGLFCFLLEKLHRRDK